MNRSFSRRMKIDPEFFGYGRMNLRKVKKVRIQLVVSEQVNHPLDTLVRKNVGLDL
jgi:hypothetical protein